MFNVVCLNSFFVGMLLTDTIQEADNVIHKPEHASVSMQGITVRSPFSSLPADEKDECD